MAITFVKSGIKFVYTKDANQPLNIVISRINTYNKFNGHSILMDVSGEISHLKFANDSDRDDAMAIVNAEFV